MKAIVVETGKEVEVDTEECLYKHICEKDLTKINQ